MKMIPAKFSKILFVAIIITTVHQSSGWRFRRESSSTLASVTVSEGQAGNVSSAPEVEENSEVEDQSLEDQGNNTFSNESASHSSSSEENENKEKNSSEEENAGKEENEEEPVGEDEAKEKGSDSEESLEEHEEKSEDKKIGKFPSVGESDEERGRNNVPDLPYHGGFSFGTPFQNVDQVKRYFKHLEKSMESIFKKAMTELGASPDTYHNSSDQIIEIDGRMYNVHTTILKGGDENNSIAIEAVSVIPIDNEDNKSKRTAPYLWR